MEWIVIHVWRTQPSVVGLSLATSCVPEIDNSYQFYCFCPFKE